MPRKNGHSFQPEQDVHRITLYNTVYPEHQHHARKERLYLHFDFACFYAQVEQLRKRMYGLPLIVGGWRKDDGTVKGIVATASYEAREFGIKTGMSALEAYQLCPYVCMLQVDYATYTAISRQVHSIFRKYSHCVERYSMDEYFMDLTFMKDKSERDLLRFCNRLQQEIFEQTNLYGTIGVARSKTYAKLSSSLDKPRGISLVLDEDQERALIYPLPLDKVWGVGRRRFEHLLSEGYRYIGDVAERGNLQTFIRLFGANFGRMLFETITGKDQARVLEEHDEYSPKWGVSYGHTFSEGSAEADRVLGEFEIAVHQICYRMRAYGIRADCFSGMIGFNEREIPDVGFRFMTPGFTNVDAYVWKACEERIGPLIRKACSRRLEIRNLVLGTHRIDKSSQTDMFFQEDPEESARWEAIDQINNRYGKGTIVTASTHHRVEGNTHFLERNV